MELQVQTPASQTSYFFWTTHNFFKKSAPVVSKLLMRTPNIARNLFKPAVLGTWITSQIALTFYFTQIAMLTETETLSQIEKFITGLEKNHSSFPWSQKCFRWLSLERTRQTCLRHILKFTIELLHDLPLVRHHVHHICLYILFSDVTSVVSIHTNVFVFHLLVL